MNLFIRLYKNISRVRIMYFRLRLQNCMILTKTPLQVQMYWLIK